jgi:hypothetical protein
MNVEVHIERLVLNGVAVAAAEQPALQAAVEAELGRRLAAEGLAPRLLAGGEVQRLPGGTVVMEDQPAPDQLGARIAGAIQEGIG